ncbi:metal ABC transporter substrate-binding protein [Bacillus sp. FJAT-49736]|uniref:metal ABC transporter substrate-binding protein n=1 Tax=Bacillus sp. FJAT-49736 TaxID=2833582 RepID=UPI001BC9CB47|nr:metal ABC transporter substrate-binding protein [Bacillus sp. FJAT-49736]MBS4174919.1 zinc ABC transporter substrate-binding protein [Bacillus sp. FJAT-49736]
MRHLKKANILLLLSTFILLLAGCANSGNENRTKDSGNNKMKVVTTFYPMYEFTKNVAGDKANVQLLIPSNVEPHDWEPTPKDVANIQMAKLLVYNSASLETWVPNIQKSLGKSGPTFVAASNDITLMKGVGDEDSTDGKEEMDPHVWLSPALAQQEVKTITKALVKADPKNKSYYEKNSKDYINKLQVLDNKFRSELKDVKRNEIITQHAAFGYLAKEYNLKQVPIAGLSPDQEPSPAKLAELKKFAKKHDLKVIYYEELASPKVANTLAKEIGAKTKVLNTLEGLSKADQKKGMDYISVMEENLASLKQTLNE